MPTNKATVLIVDDESAIADGYAAWLSDDYRTRTAYSGEEALERLNEDVDVVLLDRRMPEMSGDELLSEIRDRDLLCRVAIISAVEPDFDIVELGYDTYIEKPIASPEKLREVVETMLRRSTYDEQMRRFFSLASKVGTLEAKKSPSELDASEEYASICEEMDEVERQLAETTSELDNDDFQVDLRGRNDAESELLEAVADRLDDEASQDESDDFEEDESDAESKTDSEEGGTDSEGETSTLDSETEAGNT